MRSTLKSYEKVTKNKSSESNHNFMDAYRDWPNDIYNEATKYNGDLLDKLARRKFHMLACDNDFQEYFDEMTPLEGTKMAMSIYGDVGFRVSAVAHGRFYREAGAKVRVQRELVSEKCKFFVFFLFLKAI